MLLQVLHVRYRIHHGGNNGHDKVYGVCLIGSEAFNSLTGRVDQLLSRLAYLLG